MAKSTSGQYSIVNLVMDLYEFLPSFVMSQNLSVLDRRFSECTIALPPGKCIDFYFGVMLVFDNQVKAVPGAYQQVPRQDVCF